MILPVLLVAYIIWYNVSVSKPAPKPQPPAAEETTAETLEIPIDGEEAKPEEPVAETPVDPDKPRIVVHVTEDSWMQIMRGESLLLSKIFRKGESYEVPFTGEGLRLDSGNIGGLEFEVDGARLPPLGPKGSVMRGVILSPEALKKDWH